MPDPFYVRFNIDVPVEEARTRFINRIENRVRKMAKALYDASQAHHTNVLDPLMIEVETALGEPHLDHVSSPNGFVLAWRERVADDFSRCLLAIEGLYQALAAIAEVLPPKLSAAVTETINQSEVDLGIAWQGGLFLKKGAELLDEKLVNEPLRWLAEPKYETVLIPFKKGLSHLLEGTKDKQRFGDAVSDMYEALEAMAKIITDKPSKDLAGLREEFVAKVRIPPPYKNMLKEYIDYGCDFRHAVETGQQRSWPLEHEAEAFVYLTGLFIRLAIQSEKL